MADIAPRPLADPAVAAARRARLADPLTLEVVRLREGERLTWARIGELLGLGRLRARDIYVRYQWDRADEAGYDMRPRAANFMQVDPEAGARATGDPDTPGSGRELPP